MNIKHQPSSRMYHPIPIASHRRNLFSALGLTIILLTTALLLFMALRSTAPWSLDIGPANDEQFVFDFYGAEHDESTTFRWSGPQSQLTLYGASGRRLFMRLYGYGEQETNQNRLQLSTSGKAVGTFSVDGGWRVYRVLLPPGTSNDVIPLDFASPAHRSSADDPRELGAAAIDWVQVAPLNGGTDGWLLPLTHASMLAWMLGLIAVALAVAYSSITSQPFSLPPWTIIATTLVAAILVIWASRDPYTQALAIPNPPIWMLLTASLFLAGWLWRHETRDARQGVWSSRFTPHVSRLAPILLALLLHITLFLPLSVDIRGVAALVLLSLPGALLSLWWFREDNDPVVKSFLSLCAALTLQQLLIYTLQMLPGPLRWWELLLANDAILLSLVIVSYNVTNNRQPTIDERRKTKDESRTSRTANRQPSTVNRQPLIALALVLLLAGFVRFTHLGSAEFQADEIRPMYLAAGILHGQEGILLLHRKGPTEVLLPAGPLVLLEQTNELVARLPFAFAGMGIVLGVYLLARSLFRGRLGAAVGIMAGAIIAIDGFLLAFSRIVQYQSIVVLMGLAAIWCAWRCYEGASFGRYLIGAAVFSAMSMLAHYDGIFVVPVLAFLALAACRRRGFSITQSVSVLWPTVAVGLLLLLSFYGPFFFSERFERTTAYLGRRLSEQPAFVETTGGPPFNNLPGYYAVFTFYNITAQMQWYALLLGCAIAVWLVRYVRPRTVAFACAAMFVLGCIELVLVPDRLLLPNGGSLVGVLFAVALAAPILARQTPFALRVVLLWFATPFLAEAFLIAKPDTHFYNIHVPAALLIALALVGAVRWLATRKLRWLATPLLAVHAVVVLLAIPYLNLLFVRQMPEYQSLFPALRPSIYEASYGDKRPAGGTFGFPNRSGWKAVGTLYEQGVLHGDFESNGMKQIVGWYTRDVFRCYDQPAYYFVDRMPKNPVKIPIDYVRSNYHLFGYVLVDGVRMLDIYSKAPVNEPPRAFSLGEYTRPFDGQVVNDFPTSRLLTNEIVPQRHLIANWQGGITLRGFDLGHDSLAAGETAVMSFYWQAAGPIAPGYSVAVQIVNGDGQIVGNGTPYCGGDPPEEWYTQYVNDIAFKVTPSEQMPPGSYTLRVGLRQGQNGLWLPLADGSETVPFAQIQVPATTGSNIKQ